MTDPAMRRIAAQLSRMQGQIRALSRPQLAYSSIEDGAIDEHDDDGNTRSSTGHQWDGSNGSYPYRGPTPPTPTVPTVVPIISGLVISWDGEFAGDAVPPMDFARVEVHVSDSDGFDPSFATSLRGTIETPRGGDVSVAVGAGTWYVKLVARSLAGLAGDPSVQASAQALSIEDWIGDIGSGTRIFYGPDTPADPVTGELWYHETDAGPPPLYVTQRWDGTDWLDVNLAGVNEAIADALAAQQAADNADADALAAAATAGTAQTAAEAAQGTAEDAAAAAAAAQSTAEGKITSYYAATAPGAPGLVAGDLWVDTDDNSLHRWDGSAWVGIVDAGISQALADAATAQATADGKVRIFAQAGQPSGETVGDVGDLWVDTDDGNRLYTWSGTAWVSRQLGNGAIEPGSLIASNVVATGTVSTALLEAQAVTADKMAVGTITADSGILAELAVTNANIQDLSANKITTGTLNADLTVSGTIKTAVTGPRVELSYDGVSVYNTAADKAISVVSNNAAASDTELLLTGDSFASTADDASLEITGDIDIRIHAALDQWVPGGYMYLAAKQGAPGISWAFAVYDTGKLFLKWDSRYAVATSDLGFTPGELQWVRVTLDRSSSTVLFYSSVNGSSWSQMSASTGTGSPLADGGSSLLVGARSPGVAGLAGRVRQFELRDGIGGTVVASPGFTTQTAGDGSFTDAQGNTWTMYGGAQIVSQSTMGVPEIKVRNPSGGAQISIHPATDDLGSTSEVELVPRELSGHSWAGARLSAGVDNFNPGDDRPVVRLIAPGDQNHSPQNLPAVALYGNGDVTTHSELNLFADKFIIAGGTEPDSAFASVIGWTNMAVSHATDGGDGNSMHRARRLSNGQVEIHFDVDVSTITTGDVVIATLPTWASPSGSIRRFPAGCPTATQGTPGFWFDTNRDVRFVSSSGDRPIAWASVIAVYTP